MPEEAHDGKVGQTYVMWLHPSMRSTTALHCAQNWYPWASIVWRTASMSGSRGQSRPRCASVPQSTQVWRPQPACGQRAMSPPGS